MLTRTKITGLLSALYTTIICDFTKQNQPCNFTCLHRKILGGLCAKAGKSLDKSFDVGFIPLCIQTEALPVKTRTYFNVKLTFHWLLQPSCSTAFLSEAVFAKSELRSWPHT